MRFPDCRTDENYNQNMLEGYDKEYIRGYDSCVINALDNFFENEMGMLQDTASYTGHFLNKKLPKMERFEYTVYFPDGTTETRKAKTYADLIRVELLRWTETTRNEIITALIDNATEEKEKAE